MTINRSITVPRAVALFAGAGGPWLIAAGCSGRSTDALIGEYATEKGKEAELRVEASGAKYRPLARQGKEWKPIGELSPCSDSYYQSLLGDRWKDARPVGLSAAGSWTGIIKVPEGLTTRSHEFRTGYFFMLNILVHGDVYKVR